MYYVLVGSFSRPFQGVSHTEPALVHQCHHGHNTSLPQAEVQGKGMYDIQSEYSSDLLQCFVLCTFIAKQGKSLVYSKNSHNHIVCWKCFVTLNAW